MTAAPRLGAGWEAAVVAGEGAILYSERDVVVMPGSLAERLLALVDGERTADDLVDLIGEHQPAEVFYALRRLERQGIVTDRAPSPAAPPPDVANRARKMPARPVVIHWATALPTDEVRAALDQTGLVEQADGAPVTLVVVDDYLDPRLLEFATTADRPWFPAKLAGADPWLGPLIRPEAPPCWRCVARPVARNRPGHAYLLARTGRVWHPGSGADRSQLPARAARLRTELEWAAGADGTSRILAGDPPAAHPVHRRRRCPTCGDQAAAAPLRAEHQGGGEGGEWRSEAAARFVARHRHLIDRVTGLVPDLRPLGPVATPGSHVVLAGPGPIRLDGDLTRTSIALRSQVAGHGPTPIAAEASALGEAIERHAGVWDDSTARVRASFDELGSRAIDPRDVMLFSAAQYRDRAAWNVSPWPAARVPRPFDSAEPVDWIPLTALGGGPARYLPAAILYYGHPDQGPDSPFVVDSNGCAAGASWDDAVVAGVLELIERDAAAIWWYNRLLRRGAPITMASDGYPGEVARRLDALGRRCWVLDLTTDLGVPVVAAISGRREPPEGLVMGLGAHFDGTIATLKALAEMTQMLAVASQLSDDEWGDVAPPALSWWLLQATTKANPHLLAEPRVPTLAWPAPPPSARADPLGHCTKLLTDRGLVALVLDQTDPDIGTAVARVVVPGLRPLHPRFAPGRLFDQPVELGLLSAAAAEADLNPVPLSL